MLKRSATGSAITETGPALFLLIVLIFFPMLDLISLGAGYIMSGIYHDYMIRELALSAPPGSGADSSIQSKDKAIQKINKDFETSSFFNFLRMSPGDASVVSVQYLPDDTNPTTVQCKTRCVIQPFISIPWWTNLPGLNAPINFEMETQRPQEEKGRN
ncbi:MAG: hypothetical protein K2X27_02870 [Candidatus Obscuribacterales bacterium]|nr:hypothetical protein [Candidatus Obscuribacterales bacterium]